MVTANGYGSITLPNGTDGNVLRVKNVQDYSDTSMATVFFTYHAENIFWFLPDVHFPIAFNNEITANSQPAGSFSSYMNPIWPTAVNEIKNLASFISFYPNPANDRLNIKAKESMQDAEIILCSMNGAQLLAQPLTNGSTSIDVSALSNGTYLMHLRNEGRNIAGEIVTVQH